MVCRLSNVSNGVGLGPLIGIQKVHADSQCLRRWHSPQQGCGYSPPTFTVLLRTSIELVRSSDIFFIHTGLRDGVWWHPFVLVAM
jgi:hypothetical protein